ncbi:hypothetical protein AV530_013660 [Patagioenas fasciata monilis]|uniref:Uncharacterized protein n=1 Tax=Patagioenas fasciata monilis TaxID=372326 RepID=A0A1V4J7N6_PATFA|nr:hypothetical protein AV530_013660 [Patagioenas fasciata monilis]
MMFTPHVDRDTVIGITCGATFCNNGLSRDCAVERPRGSKPGDSPADTSLCSLADFTRRCCSRYAWYLLYECMIAQQLSRSQPPFELSPDATAQTPLLGAKPKEAASVGASRI